MTEALVMELPTEAAPLTHDGFHWSEVINLLKAQVLLNNIADVLPAAADQPAAPLQYGVPLPYRRSLSGS